MSEGKTWFLYIVECSDKTLYTGITNNLDKRISQHNNGSGAKYTKGRSPVKLLYTESFNNRSEASKREYQIKQLTKKEKHKLINLGENYGK